MSVRSTSRDGMRAEWLWLGGLLLVVTALRFVHAGSDPMPQLDWGFISDAGTWWKNPRLHAVWGVWTFDDGNFGLLTGPSYTAAMRGIFAMFGVGYAQAFATSALSGIACVAIVYAMTRPAYGALTALLAAAFTGINAMTLAYDRSSYPEAFQGTMMTATVAAIVLARGRSWVAALGGVAVIITLLAKPPGLVLAPVATATWIAVWLLERPSARGTFSWRPPIVYALTATVVLAVVILLFFVPRADDLLLHFKQQMSDGAAFGSRDTGRLQLFGTRLGMRLNGFFSNEWHLIVLAGLFGALRLAGVIRREISTLEVACWVWIVLGLGIMGMQTYQQDRRFLFLIPPLSILSSILLTRAVELGASHWTSSTTRRVGAGLAVALVVWIACFYASPLLMPRVAALTKSLGLPWTRGFATGMLASVAALVTGLLVGWRVPSVRVRLPVLPQLAIAAALLLIIGARAARQVATREYGLQQVSETIKRISHGWPMADRVAVGWPAGTLTLGSNVLPANHELKGLRAAERFRPQFELYAVAVGGTLNRSEHWDVPGRPRKVECTTLPIWDGRYIIHIFVEPDRLAACQLAAQAPAPTS